MDNFLLAVCNEEFEKIEYIWKVLVEDGFSVVQTRLDKFSTEWKIDTRDGYVIFKMIFPTEIVTSYTISKEITDEVSTYYDFILSVQKEGIYD